MSTSDKANGATTLVLGGTGKTGRRVVERLAARGLPTRIGSRSGEPPFDWEDQATWVPALRGVGVVYLLYYPDLAVPGAVEAVRSFVELALEGERRRLVLLSGRGEEEAQRAEQVVRESGAEWTIVRASWFAQNFSENYWLDPVLGGEVVLPAGDVGEPFVDADDIADVAVAALTEAGHAGQLYELTGPRLLTFAEAVAEIAASDRPGHPVCAGLAGGVRRRAGGAGCAGRFIWLVNYLFTTVLDGRNAHLTDGVRRALGRQPRDFADYARETAAAGVWTPRALGGGDERRRPRCADAAGGPRLRAMGGVFFAFSAFVMQALARLPPAQGIAAMQSINVAAVTPPFMVALFGTALACLGWRSPPSFRLREPGASSGSSAARSISSATSG